MSEQARIETAIDTTIDNCEVLRARLAKYEDADGKPITTIAEQAREISSLRNIISECATACGAAVSVECSLEFMAMLPDEIRTVMTGKSREIERLEAEIEDTLIDWGQIRLELAALKAQSSGLVRWPEADEIMQMAFEEGQPGEDASGYYFELEEFDLFIQRLIDEVARLNQSASGCEPLPHWEPCNPGCDPDFNGQRSMECAQLCRPARAALSANHSEQVLDLPPFAQKVISKLKRFEECTDDGQGADIGRHWFDLLTQLGLLNRVQRSHGLWEITVQGEDVLAAAPSSGSQEQG